MAVTQEDLRLNVASLDQVRLCTGYKLKTIVDRRTGKYKMSFDAQHCSQYNHACRMNVDYRNDEKSY